MNVLAKLTIDNLQKNRRRTLVTIFGVMLSSALILAVAAMAASFHQMLIDQNIKEVGNYHEMYENVPVNSLKYVEKNTGIAEYYYSEPVNLSNLSDENEAIFYETHSHYRYDAELVTPLSNKGFAERYNIFVRYKNVQDYENVRENILYVLKQQTGEDINYRTNSSLLQYDGVFGDATAKAIYRLCAFVIGIIVLTSIFSIRNSFSISANERIRQFGMLSSIGGTPKQISRSVLMEGFIVGIAGTLSGIAVGIFASTVLVLIVNSLVGEAFGLTIRLTIPFWIIPSTIILSLITVLLSAYLPARRAAKMSSVEAIRGYDKTKINSKRLKAPRLVNLLFGIGGVIAVKNLKRSRKKYRTTVFSIVISVATFVGLTTFVNIAFKSIETMYKDIHYNVYIDADDINKIKTITDKFNFKDYAYYQSVSTESDHQFLLMNKESFIAYAKSLGVKTDDYSKVVILNDYEKVQTENNTEKVVRHYKELNDGDDLVLSTFNKDGDTADLTIKISKITDQFPYGQEMSRIITFVASEEYAGVNPLSYVNFVGEAEDAAAVIKYVEENYPSAVAENVEEITRMLSNFYLLFAIFLYGFITVVSLIGVTSIFNTITTNIALRAKEFAMLRSIGMTSREFNRMVRLESLMYSGKAYLIGLPLGLLISYGIYHSFSLRIDFGYQPPFIAIIISVLAVATLIWGVMAYSVRKINKQNIIETIREDNI